MPEHFSLSFDRPATEPSVSAESLEMPRATVEQILRDNAEQIEAVESTLARRTNQAVTVKGWFTEKETEMDDRFDGWHKLMNMWCAELEQMEAMRQKKVALKEEVDQEAASS